MLIEDIIIFLEAVCAGPGRENACRDRAGAHKVLSKFVRFASILSSFLLTQFVLFRSCKVLDKPGSFCFDPAKFSTNPVRFVSFL